MMFKQIIKNFVAKCGDWRIWYFALLAAVTTIVALCVLACAPTAINSKEQSTKLEVTAIAGADSAYLATRVTSREAIPSDTARISLSISNLRDLPPSALYEQRKGRAKVKIERRDTTLLITASCDSLQRLVDYYSTIGNWYQRRYEALQSTKTEQHIEKKTRSPTRWWWLLPIGLGLGIVTRLILLSLFKRFH